MRKKSLLILLAFLMMIMLGGCANESAVNDNQQELVKNVQEQPADTDTGVKNNTQAPNQETMKLTVYHATKDAMHVTPEVHVVPKNDHPLKTTLELLLAGPKNTDLVAVMPQGVKVLNVKIKDHVAYVDFNDKLIKNYNGGSAGETLLVAALVNTITEFPNIQKVQILVNGKKIDTIGGHLDTSEPFSRNEKIIKK